VQPRGWRLRIEDILGAIDRVRSFTIGMSYEDFAADEKTVAAVRYYIVVIGEAANHVPSEIADRFADVPWSKMRGMRNVLVHAYFSARTEVLWATATINLPALVEPLRRLLDSAA
jgi:uncharacterized protein with HEPN domain